MMTLFGLSVSATAPWFLLGLPLSTALLVYAYRRRGSHAHAVVSTLLLLRRLPQQPVARKRFLPPLQFWLELASLWLLSAAAAGLSLQRNGAVIAVVIDTSASMEAPSSEGASRIERAKRAASADMLASPSTNRFALFTTNPAQPALSAAPLSAGEARRAVNALQATASEDQLAPLLSNLLSSGQYSSVWAYTDQNLSAEAAPRVLRLVSVAGQAPAGNVWVRSLTLSGPDTLAVGLTAVGGGGSVDVTVTTTCSLRENNDAALQLTPHTPAAVRVQLPLATPTTARVAGLDPRWAFCQVTASSTAGSGTDTISVDNSAWIVNDAQARQVTLFSQLSPQQLKIASLRGLEVVARPPDAPRPGGAIYHRTLPPPAPLTGPTLIVYPPPGELPAGGRGSELL